MSVCVYIILVIVFNCYNKAYDQLLIPTVSIWILICYCFSVLKRLKSLDIVTDTNVFLIPVAMYSSFFSFTDYGKGFPK